MPSLTFAGGKLMLIYYDLRDDVSQSFAAFADDTSARPSGLRHTMDIRASLGTPGPTPAFAPSVKVSDYVMGSRLGSHVIEQLQFNPPNLPMFKQGTVPFVGDYIDITPAPAFVPDGRGGLELQHPGRHDAAGLPRGVDRQPRRAAADGAQPATASLDWDEGLAAAAPAVQPGRACATRQSVGSRNQNIYTARITGGLLVGSPGNNKPLDADAAARLRGVRAEHDGADQDVPDDDRAASRPAGARRSSSSRRRRSRPRRRRRSSHRRARRRRGRSRRARCTSPRPNPQAQVQVDVREIAAVGGAAVPGGLRDRVILNPDIENPDIENPDIQNPDIAEPGHRERRGPQPGHREPRHREPRHSESRHSEPRHRKPGYPESRHPEPRHSEPRDHQRRGDEPGHREPRHRESGHPESRHPEPRHPEPRHPEPRHPERRDHRRHLDDAEQRQHDDGVQRQPVPGEPAAAVRPQVPAHPAQGLQHAGRDRLRPEAAAADRARRQHSEPGLRHAGFVGVRRSERSAADQPDAVAGAG